MNINLRNFHIESIPLHEFINYSNEDDSFKIRDRLLKKFELKGSDAIFIKDIKIIKDNIFFFLEWGYDEE
jgi:hypothetical protein